MRKEPIFMIISLLILSTASALLVTVENFDDGSGENNNITLITGDLTKTKYVSVPNSTIINASFDMISYPISDFVYQENGTSQTVNSFWYDSDGYVASEYLYDGLWSTRAKAKDVFPAIYYVNYSKIKSSTNDSLWQVKRYINSFPVTEKTTNETIPFSCWNFSDVLQLRIIADWTTYPANRNIIPYTIEA